MEISIQKCSESLTKNTKPTIDFVKSAVATLVGPQETLLTAVKKHKLVWFGHVAQHDTLSKTVLQGSVVAEVDI